MDEIFFKDWQSLVRILIVTVLAYGGMLLLLRVSGKRTLSKMNAFDLIVTFALGSSLASVSVSKDVSLAEGMLFIALLILLQYIVSSWNARSQKADKFIGGRATLLLYKGELFDDVLIKERISRSDIDYNLRKQGISDISSVYAMVLETSGEVTVIPDKRNGSEDAMKDLENFYRMESD